MQDILEIFKYSLKSSKVRWSESVNWEGNIQLIAPCTHFKMQKKYFDNLSLEHQL